MDRRVTDYVAAYTQARNARFLGRGAGRQPSPEELAGWALQRASLKPLEALGVLRLLVPNPTQRAPASALLRALVTSIPLGAASPLGVKR